MREGREGADDVLLDPASRSAPTTRVDVSVEDISEDGRCSSTASAAAGRTRRSCACATSRGAPTCPDVLPRGLYRGVSLMPDGSGFYYAAQSRADRHPHPLPRDGDAGGEDVEVFGSGYGPGQWIGAEVSENGRHLLLTVQHGWARNEVFVQDLPRRRSHPHDRQGRARRTSGPISRAIG